MRYNRMAEDLKIPADLVKSEMMAPGAKIGDPMTITLAKDKAEQWFGVAPPDLSLVARLRGSDWLYNYLNAFYVDDATVSGWNNAVFPNVAMPHVLAEWQGRQSAEFSAEGEKKSVTLNLDSAGTMSDEEFKHAMGDLTNFLVYMGEPAKLKRIGYGLWVMLFLALFGFFAYLLKKDYWRDVDVSH